jgi:cytoskeleton protein RodZ
LTDAQVTGVGAQLAHARESQGLGLAEVAQQLKFSQRQLEALEAERFGELPGATIARGMLRNYARLLKLDPDPLLERIAARLGTPDSSNIAARFSQAVPFSDGSRRSTLAYLGFSLVLLAVVGAVGWQWHQERKAEQRLPFVKASPPPASQPAAGEPEPVAVASAQPPPAVQEDKPMAVIEKPEPRAKPLTPGVHRLVIRCEEEAWVEVTDGMGRSLVSSLHPAGTERVVQARGPFELVIGNARSVRLTLDERPIDLARHIGRHSDVARLKLP